MTTSVPGGDTRPYDSTTTLEDLALRLGGARSVALVTHRKPDGDALGSVLAMARVCASRGIEATPVLVGPIEPALASVAGDLPLTIIDPDADEAAAAEACPSDPGVILVLDTGAWSQVEPLGAWLRGHAERVIGVDHHARGDVDLAGDRVVVTTAASTTRVLIDLLDAMAVPLTPEVAEPLFLGLATDTGWFRHANAGPDAFRAASRLLDVGVDRDRLYQQIEETHRPARLALAARALGSLRYGRGGEVAVQSLGPDDFAETGGAPEDLVGLVNGPMVVGGVRVAILATESTPGVTKLSLRGKPGVGRWADADVNDVAAAYGGGGHRFAAGARIKAPLADAVERLMADLEARPSLESNGRG